MESELSEINCKNKEDLLGEEYVKIKSVATIKREDVIYCFSCYDLSGQLNKNDIHVSYGHGKLHITDVEKRYLLDFYNNNKCKEENEELPQSESRVTTEKDTEPYIEKLGILDKAKAFQVSFRDNMGYGDVQQVGNLLQFVKEYTKKFFIHHEQEIPPELDFNSIQNEMKTSNIFDSAIEYYKKIYKYLLDFELLDLYKNYKNEEEIETKSVKTLIQEYLAKFKRYGFDSEHSVEIRNKIIKKVDYLMKEKYGQEDETKWLIDDNYEYIIKEFVNQYSYDGFFTRMENIRGYTRILSVLKVLLSISGAHS